MSHVKGVLCLDGWAGRVEVPVTIIGETPKRYRVILGRECRLPSRRWGNAGDTILVPKYAICVEAAGE
jgi:hypothetical protein